jgi:hypothetical protein
MAMATPLDLEWLANHTIDLMSSGIGAKYTPDGLSLSDRFHAPWVDSDVGCGGDCVNVVPMAIGQFAKQLFANLWHVHA